MANYKTTLKDITKQNTIYPQTLSDIVYNSDGSTVEQSLDTLTERLDRLKDAEKFVGYYRNLNALLAEYPEERNDEPISDAESEARAGYFARVGGVGEEETYLYLWDIEGKKWVQSGGAGGGTGSVDSVNGISPDSSGNVYLTANNIPTVFTDGASVQSHLADLKNKYNDLDSAITEIKPELEALKNKPLVLYLTNQEMTNAVNSLVEPYDNGQLVIATDDGTYTQGSAYVFVVGGTSEYPEYSWLEISSSSDIPTDASIKLLVGTDEEPINVYDLDVGLYLIKGKVKLCPAYQVGKIYSKYWSDTTGTDTEVSSETLLNVTGRVDDKVYASLPLAYPEGIDIRVASGYDGASIAYTVMTINADGVGTYIGNFGDYANYGYVDAKVEELRTQINSIKPIINVANPSTISGEKYEDTLIGNSNISIKELYFGKKIGEVLQYKPVETGVNMSNFVIDKNIVNMNFGSNNSFTMCWLELKLDEYSAVNWSGVSLSCNSEGVVNGIYDSFGNYLYTLEEGWKTLSTDNDPNYYNINQYFRDTNDGGLQLILITDLYDTPRKGYLYNYVMGSQIEPVKLALYEDLESLEIDTSNLVDLTSIQTITGVKTFKEQVGIANADGTIDYIKHMNNNFLISTSTGTNLLNIDEQLNTVDMMGEKVMRASDFVLEGTTLTINLD